MKTNEYLRIKGLNYQFKIKGSNFNGDLLELLNDYNKINKLAMCEANSNAVLADVSSVDEARDYLKTLCYYKFKDKTFINYIENKLAGDFAVEIANVFIRDRNARNFS